MRQRAGKTAGSARRNFWGTGLSLQFCEVCLEIGHILKVGKYSKAVAFVKPGIYLPTFFAHAVYAQLTK